MTGVYRHQVLSLYRQILHFAKSWKSISGLEEQTTTERAYIKEEAQRLFRKNKYEISKEKIQEHMKEAETRMGLAAHYGIPYPRLMNYPPNVLPTKGHSKFTKDKKILSQATPIYLKSYEDENQPNR